MKFRDKYKLYRSIMKQKPYDIAVCREDCNRPAFGAKGTIDSVNYNVDNFNIRVYCENYLNKTGIIRNILSSLYYVDLPWSCYAFICDKSKNYFIHAEFNGLLAKRLLNHGKKYSK